MTAPLPHLLRLVEGVTRQRAVVGLDPARTATVGDALELFLRPASELVGAGGLAPDGIRSYEEMGECLFRVEADGELGSLHKGLAVLLGHEPLELSWPLRFERRPVPGLGEVMLADLTVDRRSCTYERDWAAFHERKWRQSRESFEGFVHEAARAAYGEAEADRVIASASEADRARALRAAAERIYSAPFELYSRFVGTRRLIKDGAATIHNVIAGHGGACSEKAQAVRLLADGLGLEAEYVLSGPGAAGEVPVDALLEILDTFDVQYSRAVQSYWNHVAVLVRAEGEEILVDASNGNLPFLWVRGEPLRAMLDVRGEERVAVTHKYVVETDELYYNRVEQVVPEQLLYALELGWADPHIDLVQVLDDELGLLGGRELWIGVLAHRDDEERRTIERWYEERWLETGKVRGLAFSPDLGGDDELTRALWDQHPAAAAAAVEGRSYLEQRLEEANPGEGYRAELVVAGRLGTEESR